jgi:hypothetical protein
MITLIFLICLPTGECSTTGPEVLFATEEQCVLAADGLITSSEMKVASGELPMHSVVFQCVPWGYPV